jgi:hypothetical protein
MPRRSAWDPEPKAGEVNKPPRTPISEAVTRLRYRCSDAGVKLALDLAEAGESVVYASDWSPGSANEDTLRAVGVDLHTKLRGGR